MSSSASTKNDKRKSKSGSRSSKTGLQFSVSRVSKNLKIGKYAERISADAPCYLAAVMECLAAEVLELAGSEAMESQQKRITPKHIQMAVSKNNELRKLFEGVTIASCGANPNFNQPPDTK